MRAGEAKVVLPRGRFACSAYWAGQCRGPCRQSPCGAPCRSAVSDDVQPPVCGCQLWGLVSDRSGPGRRRLSGWRRDDTGYDAAFCKVRGFGASHGHGAQGQRGPTLLSLALVGARSTDKDAWLMRPEGPLLPGGGAQLQSHQTGEGHRFAWRCRAVGASGTATPVVLWVLEPVAAGEPDPSFGSRLILRSTQGSDAFGVLVIVAGAPRGRHACVPFGSP